MLVRECDLIHAKKRRTSGVVWHLDDCDGNIWYVNTDEMFPLFHKLRKNGTQTEGRRMSYREFRELFV